MALKTYRTLNLRTAVLFLEKYVCHFKQSGGNGSPSKIDDALLYIWDVYGAFHYPFRTEAQETVDEMVINATMIKFNKWSPFFMTEFGYTG